MLLYVQCTSTDDYNSWNASSEVEEAGLSVSYLRKSDSAAFKASLDAIYGGAEFRADFETAYRVRVAERWRQFAGGSSTSPIDQ
jgi:hypothetical protein